MAVQGRSSAAARHPQTGLGDRPRPPDMKHKRL
jgi:hypothetical protein